MSRPARDGAAERQGQRAARSNGDGLSVRQIAVSGQVPPRLCPGQGGPLRLVPFVVQDGYPQDLKAVRPGMEVGGPDHRQSGARSSALSSQVPSRTCSVSAPSSTASTKQLAAP